MVLGVQFRGSIPGGQTRRWFTHSWNEAWRVVWLPVPTWPLNDGPAQLEWKIQVTRQAAGLVKYFIEVRNLTGGDIEFEARYAILNL